MLETADSRSVSGNSALSQAWVSAPFSPLTVCLIPPFQMQGSLSGAGFLGSSSVEGEGGGRKRAHKTKGGLSGGQGAGGRPPAPVWPSAGTGGLSSIPFPGGTVSSAPEGEAAPGAHAGRPEACGPSRTDSLPSEPFP